jgi:two-component system chemotaxis response regulator CheB
LLVVGGSGALRAVLEETREIAVVAQLPPTADVAAEIVRGRAALVIVVWPTPAGVRVIEEIMAQQPVPIVVTYDAGSLGDDERAALDALLVSRGALAMVPFSVEPVGDHAARLRAEIRALARVPVVRHPRVAAPAAPAPATAAPRIVGIGASAGGPGAVAAIVRALPPDFSLPVVVVQHLPAGFAEQFASYLRQHAQHRCSDRGLDPGRISVGGVTA